MRESFVDTFLARRRFTEFLQTLRLKARSAPPFRVFLAVMRGILPGLSYLLLPIQSIDTPAFVLLVAMLGGLLFRSRITAFGERDHSLSSETSSGLRPRYSSSIA